MQASTNDNEIVIIAGRIRSQKIARSVATRIYCRILIMTSRAFSLLSAQILTTILYLTLLLGFSRAQYLNSPCPDIFTYQADPGTKQIFGYIELNGIQIGQVAKLNVDLTIATRLSSRNVGSITLIKSREATFNDIQRGLPAQYRVNFPLQNIIPTVLSIALNGQTICTGSRTEGQVVTTINLEHTLYTQLHTQGGMNFNGFQFQQPVDNNVRPVQQFRPPETEPTYTIVQPQSPPIQWNVEPVTTRPTQVQSRPMRPVRPVVTRPEESMPVFSSGERNTVAPPVSNYACGKAQSSLNSLSINGELATKGQFPWIVPLFDRTQPRNPKYMCGSTIITKKHLITAAHCVYELGEVKRPSQLLAVPGMYNIDNFFDENAHIADIAEVVPHDDYVDDDTDAKDADVAVLRLKVELVYSNYVVPICPWPSDNDLSKIVGLEAVVAGWGITETGKTSSVPTYTKAVIVTRQQCIVNLARPYPSNWRVFCGDGRGTAPCRGDSGSGLVMKRGNQYYLRGVVSVGQFDSNAGICNTTAFTIYTDVAPFRFWLKSVTG